MKIEVEIEVTEDGSYGATLAKRKLTLEAEVLPSSIGDIVGDITNQTIAQAKDKQKLRRLPLPDVDPVSPPAPRSIREDETF